MSSSGFLTPSTSPGTLTIGMASTSTGRRLLPTSAVLLSFFLELLRRLELGLRLVPLEAPADLKAACTRNEALAIL